MNKNQNRIMDMMMLNAAMGAAMSLEEVKLLSRYLNSTKND